MTNIKYTKAPISEVVFGVIFKSNILAKNAIIFDVMNECKKMGYTVYSTNPSVPEEIISNNSFQYSIDYQKSGFAVHKLYTPDKNFLVQIQNNFIIFNWVRPDDQEVGNYPGFTSLFQRFKDIVEATFKILTKNDPNFEFKTSLKTLVLTYHDRVDIEQNPTYTSDILQIDFPKLSANGGSESPESIHCKFTRPLVAISGYQYLMLATGVSFQNKKILIVESKFKSEALNENYETWFKKGNEIQNSFFERIFTDNIKTTWK